MGGLIGCNFVCKNEDCEYVNTGFTLTGLWPVGDIDTIIENCEDDGLKEALLKKKEMGCDCAKINYPDPYDTPIVGHSVEKFCEKCKRIQTFIVKDGDSYETPAQCHECNATYIDFAEATEKDNEIDIKCPSCKENMAQNRWYVNDGLEREINSEDEEEEETL